MKVNLRKRYVRRELEGSVPSISEAEAYRLKVNAYDRMYNMATFKMSKVCERHQSEEVVNVLCMLKLVRQALKSEGGGGDRGWLAEEGISGSSVTAVLEGHFSRNRGGMLRGRWKAGIDDGEGVPVSDVDVFIGGVAGSTRAGFRIRVREVVSKLEAIAGRRGLAVTVEEERIHPYAEMGRKIIIQDVKVEGYSFKLSFVQAPTSGTLFEVTEKFDIDVCKVMYNPWKNEMYAMLDVVVVIERGKASVCDYVLRQKKPSKYDVRQVSSTLKRMRKYGERGYKFRKYPRLTMGRESDRSRAGMDWEE